MKTTDDIYTLEEEEQEYSPMYANLKRLYHEDKLSVQGLDNAVSKSWITAEEKVGIINYIPTKDDKGTNK